MADAFESSDSIRSGKPLAHVQTLEFLNPLKLKLGGELPGVGVAYETYGQLNEEADNAVLICHAVSGDSHAAKHDEHDDPGWWDALVGEGKAIDTTRFFVICSNVLGGCRGTTGPGAINPDTGAAYGREFPTITVEDMVDAQQRLMSALGIRRWRAVVGGSLGGHQTLCWATRYPQSVRTAVVVAASARLTSQALAFDVVARNAIQTDPDFCDGQYYGSDRKPRTGLAIARMLGHITYLSTESMTEKFDVDRHAPRDIATAFEKRFSVGSYLAYQGDQFVGRFDANSYVSVSMAMDHFDLGDDHASRVDSLKDAQCNWLVVSFSSDWLFPPSQSRDLVSAMTSLGQNVTYCEIQNKGGHDGFLLPDDVLAYAPMVAAKLGAAHPLEPDRRQSDDRILELIPPGSSVLDLGCGSGDLLARLRARGSARLCGVDVRTESIVAAVQHDVDVIDCDLNLGLPEFDDAQFDYVVLSSTLQAVPNVERLLEDALRVGERAILGFTNFAYRSLREMFYTDGRAPKAPGNYEYEWYDTPNRRFPSIRDVLDLCDSMGVILDDAHYYESASDRQIGEQDDPNFNADTALLVIRRS